MSSAPQPRPETPSRLPAAVKSRTPLPGGPTNATHIMTTSPPKRDAPEASVGETQLPSYTPTPEPESAPVSKPAEVDSQSRQETEQSSDSDEEEEGDEQSDLTGFEWSDFEHRYTEALKMKFEEECEIIEEFDKWAASFITWAQAGAEHDNGRMSKRLRTRIEFTQQQENSLEDKKKHYLGVLAAFQTAMDMLRRP
ncbi:hypothetical protein BKA65DRAFT_541437 [Rhexocercosporidium sp. MPI-PUGE-AT-0058]|nr:hypothetical protein BKA65DRAFT_541437 [Rhexocercosporidium sp. MPI-PUGE-AT-0058]